MLGMYLRTPAVHEPGSIWPTRSGTPTSKDVWMLGIGAGRCPRCGLPTRPSVTANVPLLTGK